MKETIGFFELVQQLEAALGQRTDALELIEPISERQYLDLRTQIIAVFDVGEMPPFEGEFGEEVEFGDVSDAVRGVTFQKYPQDTPLKLPIDINTRKEWCNDILTAMDDAAVYFS